MSISIVIATYNRQKKLALVLPSYQQQKNVKEIIIVDDYSSDDTDKFIKQLQKQDPRIQYIKHTERKGTCAAKNAGLDAATGDYVLLGEDDVELSEGFLETLLSHMIKSKADVVGGRRIWPHYKETKEESYNRANQKRNSPVNYDLVLVDCETNIKDDREVYLLDASMLLTKKAAKMIRWDTKLFIDFVAWRSETDFQLSAVSKGLKLVFCPHVSGYHLPKDMEKVNKLNYIKYDLWVFRNNYLFSQKHKEVLKNKLGINNLFLFNIQFILSRIKKRYFS